MCGFVDGQCHPTVWPTPQPLNGLCTCRGWWDPHPFHADVKTTTGAIETFDGYVGKHRPERHTPEPAPKE